MDGTGGTLQFDHGAQYFTVRDRTFAEEVTRLAAEGQAALWNGRVRVLHRGEVREAEHDGAVAAHQRGRRLAGRLPRRSGRRRAAAPSLATVAGGVAMTPCWSAMLAVPGPLDLAYDAAFVGARDAADRGASGAGHEAPNAQGASALSWIARDSSKPGRLPGSAAIETWMLHATAAWSAANLERAAVEVAADLLRAFAAAAAIPRIEPAFLAAHRWRYAAPAPAPVEHLPVGPGSRRRRVRRLVWRPARGRAFVSGRALAHRVVDRASVT